ncbi:MAG: hypothetical protein JNJ71_12700 [Rubrivivax sp.]|nr:hypothetical protein [Rubrivivax sp.]
MILATAGWEAGGLVQAGFQLRESGGAWRLSNPSAMDHWRSTAAAGFNTMRMELRGLAVRPFAEGIGSIRMLAGLDGAPLIGRDVPVTVTAAGRNNQITIN